MAEPTEKKKVEEFNLTDDMLTSVYRMNMKLPSLGRFVMLSAILLCISMFILLPPMLLVRIGIVIFGLFHIVIGSLLIRAGRAAGRVNLEFEAGHEGMEILLQSLSGFTRLFTILYRFIFLISVIVLLVAIFMEK
jgi:hypothetical protein